MEPVHDADFIVLEHKIHHSHAEMLSAYAEQIKGLDEHRHWALLVTKAREAGLEKEHICRELSCAWSTVTRWMAGQTTPGPFARTAIKERLLAMIAARKQQEVLLARVPEYA